MDRTGNKRPSKLRQWTNEAMEAAMRAVYDGEMGVNQASREYGVPTTTLRDRISERVTHGTPMGARSYLNQHEEETLEDFLLTTSSIGFGKTRAHVMMYAEMVAKEKNLLRKHHITGRWFDGFCKRHPDLSLRKGDSMGAVRFRCTNSEAIQNYYKLLQTTLTEHNFSGEPWRIYNVDETGMPLDPRKPRVVAKLGTKKVRVMGSGNKHQITVVACASATGHVIPPMVIFEGKNLKREWLHNEVTGTVYAMSDKGWINAPLFNEWFNHFLRHAPPGRPLLLLLDGHSTHYKLDTISKAMEQEVIILTLPPHSSQDTQPLDTGMFGPLKHYWSRECHEWMAKNPYKLMSKVHFNTVFSKAWAKAALPSNAIAGFKKAGIHPLNEEAIPVYSQSSSTSNNSSASNYNNSITDSSTSSSSIPNNVVTSDISTRSTSNSNNSTINNATSNDVPTSRVSYTNNHSSTVNNPLSPYSTGSNCDTTDDHLVTTEEFYSEETCNDTNNNDNNKRSRFTAEEIQLFERRFEEGYNVYIDQRYINWMNSTHPNCLPANLRKPITHSFSCAQYDASQQASEQQSSSKHITTTMDPITPPTKDKSQTEITTYKSDIVPIEGNKIQKYLTMPKVPEKPKSKHQTGARIVTSHEFIAELQEKEKKKKQAEEEKQQRKLERERKKIEREAAKKAKPRRKGLKKTKKSKGKATTTTRPASHTPTSRTPITSTKFNTRKRTKSFESSDDEIDENTCCVCFDEYHSDEDWVQCSCSRWLHEECSLSEVPNALDTCPHCVL